MNRGTKHVCPKCAARYYDLGKEFMACPKCGVKPLAVKMPDPAQQAKKTRPGIVWRYP